MMFKNSTKLLLANFITVWKLLAYKLVALLIVFGLFLPVIPAIEGLENFDLLSESVMAFFSSYGFNPSYVNLLVSLNAILQTLGSVISELMITLPLLTIYIMFLLFIVLPFLWHFCDVAVGETLYGYMASQTKYGFVGSMIRKLGVSVSYSILLTLAVLPFSLLALGGVLLALHLTTIGGMLLYIIPLFLFLYFLLIGSLRIALFSGWMPAIVVYNCNALTGFHKGMNALSRRFYRVWSTSLIIVFILLAIYMLFGWYALIIITPIASLFISIFNTVMFFGSRGMRFYVDMDTIITPKKLEQTDKLHRLKFIV
ncbi:MAG: hypothetical protein PHV79_01705 [Clostridia bacterium]|nr:hypothetical protein [Clostridia bacterium]MDD4408441.1 hypothetical protein [Clostridia bacterium]